jgi:hypothetical protein
VAPDGQLDGAVHLAGRLYIPEADAITLRDWPWAPARCMISVPVGAFKGDSVGTLCRLRTSLEGRHKVAVSRLGRHLKPLEVHHIGRRQRDLRTSVDGSPDP